MLTEQEILTRGGVTFENIVKLVDSQKDIITLLKDIQQRYIIKRGLTEGNEVKLMGGIEACDDIIYRIEHLEEARLEYLENKIKEEESQRKKDDEGKRRLGIQ